MIEKNKIPYITMVIFAAAFAWGLFFTYGFDFLFEDFAAFKLDKEDYPLDMKEPPVIITELKVLQGFIKEFFASHRLFQIGFSTNYSDRPYQYVTWDFLRYILGDKAIFYRVFRSIIFAINTCLVFLVINRVSILLAFLGVLLYITSSEIWLALTYTSDVGIFAQCGVIFSILLFLKLLEKKPLRQKDAWLYYSLILLTSNYAILAKGDGRYLAVMFILTILFFHRSEFRFHLVPLLLLLLMEIPVLGYIKKIFTRQPFSPIDITTHVDTFPLAQSLKLIAKNYIFPRNALGLALLVLLSIVIFMHLYSLLFRRKLIGYKKIESSNPVLKERSFFFMLWFIFSLTMSALVRSFKYDGPYNWQLYDLSYFIAPFIILLCYYISLVFNSIKKPYSAILLVVSISLIGAQIVSNGLRLNQFRGGWGNYFCAWKNVEKYIDTHSNNAMVYTDTEMIYKPFVFRKSNNKVINYCLAGAFNLSLVEKTFEEKGYSDIFLARRFGLNVEGKSDKVILKDTAVIDGNSGDLYDRLKSMIGRGSRPVISVYHFVYNKGS